MKNRMQALGLLDRAFKAASDDELVAMTEALDDDHREGVESFVDELTPDGIRTAVRAGRIDGGMEAIATILSDTCLAECIEALGDHADNPTTDQLREVLPALVEHHGRATTQLMLATTIVGEAPASAIIRDLLKSDELVALPKVDDAPAAPLVDTSKHSADEQAALREKRAAARKAKQDEARARKAQSTAARRR
jgi:hypothetical protein